MTRTATIASELGLFDRYVEALWNGGETGGIGSLVDPDFVTHDTSLGDVTGVDGHREYVDCVRRAFPGVRFDVADVYSDGTVLEYNWVAVDDRTGEPTGLRGLGSVEFSDGRLRLARGGFDPWR